MLLFVWEKRYYLYLFRFVLNEPFPLSFRIPRYFFLLLKSPYTKVFSSPGMVFIRAYSLSKNALLNSFGLLIPGAYILTIWIMSGLVLNDVYVFYMLFKFFMNEKTYAFLGSSFFLFPVISKQVIIVF